MSMSTMKTSRTEAAGLRKQRTSQFEDTEKTGHVMPLSSVGICFSHVPAKKTPPAMAVGGAGRTDPCYLRPERLRIGHRRRPAHLPASCDRPARLDERRHTQGARTRPTHVNKTRGGADALPAFGHPPLPPEPGAPASERRRAESCRSAARRDRPSLELPDFSADGPGTAAARHEVQNAGWSPRAAVWCSQKRRRAAERGS